VLVKRINRKTALQDVGMSNLEDVPPPAVGAYWIKEQDYPALLKIFPDGGRMPPTWSE